MIEEILFKAGIPSYVTTIITPIPLQNQLKIPIAKTVTPQQIGYIFGLSQLTDTVSPSGDTLITAGQAADLYLTLKDGPTEFFERIRLDQMIRTTAGFPNLNPYPYMPCRIPGYFDLSTSFYENPTGIVSTGGEEPETVVILTQLWFISTDSYEWLMEHDYLDKTYAAQFTKKKR